MGLDNNTKAEALLVLDSPDTKAHNPQAGGRFMSEHVTKKYPSRFYLDSKKERETFNQVLKILDEANQKDRGREVTFTDVVSHALSRLNSKDVEILKEKSLSNMEKVELVLAEYNQTHGLNLDMGEFLKMKLKLS